MADDEEKVKSSEEEVGSAARWPYRTAHGKLIKKEGRSPTGKRSMALIGGMGNWEISIPGQGSGIAVTFAPAGAMHCLAVPTVLV